MNTRIGQILEETGREIDIPAAARDRAIARYVDLAQWLIDEQVGIASVDVYPQGSFRLGTVVRPLDESGDFDIDLVFRRDLARTSITQDQLRQQAGDLLKRYCARNNVNDPIELGRCWRLEFFDEGFHLDVLPVIPDESVANGILLSDKDMRLWLYSNPIGYSTWFYGRMNQQDLRERRAALAAAMQRNIEQVPEFLVRTPLQRVVQLLKRSRDEYFADRADEAPPSILITTLAARAYRGQTDIVDALTDVVNELDGAVSRVDGEWSVANPAHPEENFADKWNTNPERRTAFCEWRDATVAALARAAATTEFERAGSYLREGFGLRIEQVTDRIASRPPQTLREAAQGIGRAPGEQYIEEMFPRRPSDGTATVTFEVRDPSDMNRYTRRAMLHQRRLGKQRHLRFKLVSTSVPAPYAVYWKVRNFGRQAASAQNGLRGQIRPDKGSHELLEATLYTGEHYAECYIVKDGYCVATTRIWVPIA